MPNARVSAAATGLPDPAADLFAVYEAMECLKKSAALAEHIYVDLLQDDRSERRDYIKKNAPGVRGMIVMVMTPHEFEVVHFALQQLTERVDAVHGLVRTLVQTTEKTASQ